MGGAWVRGVQHLQARASALAAAGNASSGARAHSSSVAGPTSSADAARDWSFSASSSSTARHHASTTPSKDTTSSGCEAARLKAGCLFSTSYLGSGFASSSPLSSDETASPSISTNLETEPRNSSDDSAGSLAPQSEVRCCSDGMYTCCSVARSVLIGEPCITPTRTSVSMLLVVSSWSDSLTTSTTLPAMRSDSPVVSTSWSPSMSPGSDGPAASVLRRHMKSFRGPVTLRKSWIRARYASAVSASSTSKAGSAKVLAIWRTTGLKRMSIVRVPARSSDMAAGRQARRAAARVRRPACAAQHKRPRRRFECASACVGAQPAQNHETRNQAWGAGAISTLINASLKATQSCGK